jgi:hypothetical protein
MKEGEFIYYKETKKIRDSSVKGCHICHLVWRGFLEYSMDHFRLSEEEALLQCFEKHASTVRLVHQPASGDLEFCFHSENVSRTVTLGYSFVSSKQKRLPSVAKAQQRIKMIRQTSVTLSGRSLASRRGPAIRLIPSTIGFRNVKGFIENVLK